MAADGYLPPLVTELKADVSGLRKGIDDAKAMVKKYKEDVEGLSENFKKTKTDADGAGKGVSDFERLVRSKMRSGETAVSAMRSEWDRLHKLIKETRATLAKPDGGTDANVNTLRTLTKDAAALGAIATQFGVQLGDATGKALANGATAGGPFVQAAVVTAIIGAVAIAAPVIGAAIATAVTFGIGLGVIGLAASILKERPKIKKAWETLTETSSGVFDRAAANLEKPFLKSISFLSRQFQKWEPILTKIFDAASPLIMPLTEGIAGFITNMLPGMLDAIVNAQPAFEAFGKNFPIVGAALGEFFRIITENKEDIALFTEDAMTGLARTILVIGYVISFLTSAYAWIRRTTNSVLSGINSITTTISTWWSTAVTWVKDLFKGLGTSMVDGIKAGISWGSGGVTSSLVGAVKAAWNSAKAFLQTGSPSRLMMQLGRHTAEGYALGIDGAADQAWASMKRMTMPGAASPAVAAAASSSPTYRGGGMTVEGVAHIYLDSREIQQAGIKFAQRDKIRNTTSGWG